MRRLTNTLFSIVAIVVLLFISNQAQRFGFGGLFTIVPYLMIVLIVVGLIRTWIRG
jgi:hypothetical protein